MTPTTPSVAEIMKEHVTYELESIDRLYLNGYVPGLQTPEAVAHFLRYQRGARFASSVLLDEISRDFAKRIERFVREQGVEVHRFAKGERKDDETQRRLKAFALPEGVLYLGTAQEKFTTVRTEKRVNPASDLTTGKPTVMFGTKCPSITSTCKTPAPPRSTALI